MTDSEFTDELAARDVKVIHFSLHAKMQNPAMFPDDLKHAIEAFSDEIRSCVALTPSNNLNIPGSVGVIFSPTQVSHVLSVSAKDSGSSEINGQDVSAGQKLTRAAFDESLDAVQAGGYNEWRVRGAKPVGIFVIDENLIVVRVMDSYDDPTTSKREETNFPATISLQTVKGHFPSLPVFTLRNGSFIKL